MLFGACGSAWWGAGAGARLADVFGRTAEVVVTPGNPGIPARSAPAEELEADLFVIGPEAPLVDGLADRLRARAARVRPGRRRRPVEGSKAWMKDLLPRRRRPHRPPRRLPRSNRRSPSCARCAGPTW